MKVLGRFLGMLCVATIVATMTSCGTSHTVSGSNGRVANSEQPAAANRGEANSEQPAAANRGIDGLDAMTQALLKEAYSWQGTPYLYGGNTREGIDCSGFVLQVFKKAVDIGLPRTSRQQHEYCQIISRERLEPGDLVFFATGKDPNVVSHVGIYVGSGNMIHSSSSKGVIVSSLSSNYYTSHFLAAGRVQRFYAMRSDAGRKDAAPAPKEEPVVAANAQEPPTKSVKAQKPKKEKRSKQRTAGSSEQPATANREQPAAKTTASHRGAHQGTATSADPSATDVEALRNQVLGDLPD